jgi:recombination protein RecR
MGGPEIETLIALFAKLPGLGPRSARRAVLRLLQQPATRMMPLAQALQVAAQSVRPCAECGNLDSDDPCAICADPRRDQTLVCVVGVNPGRYHVLGGVLTALGGVTPDDLNIAPLLRRLGHGGVTEIVLALGATVDGATTAHWLADRLRGFPVTISRIGHGLPIGGALDVLDDGTLAAAVKGRREV